MANNKTKRSRRRGLHPIGTPVETPHNIPRKEPPTKTSSNMAMVTIHKNRNLRIIMRVTMERISMGETIIILKNLGSEMIDDHPLLPITTTTMIDGEMTTVHHHHCHSPIESHRRRPVKNTNQFITIFPKKNRKNEEDSLEDENNELWRIVQKTKN